MQLTNPRLPHLHQQNVGDDNWWVAIQKIGTPITTAIDRENHLVSFIWRDPNGEDSDIHRVYIDLYSKTPHPTKALTYLSRIPGTDVWFWEVELTNDWLGSYFLMPATQQQLPPADRSRGAIRQWWIQLMANHAQADPLNLLPHHHNGNGVSLSAICLDKSALNLFTSSVIKPTKPPTLIKWSSQRLNNERRVWLYKTGQDSAQKTPVVLLFDGQYWIENIPLLSTLETLTNTSQLPPALYVFIDSINSDTRQKELSCNTNFINAIEKELLALIRNNYPISDDPYKTIVAGQSLGGLCAVFAGLHWPSRFASVISQSGSFWWPDVNTVPGEGELIKKVEQLNITPLNILIAAGSYEQDMLTGSQIMANTLQKKGHYVNEHVFKGGHDWLCWRQSLVNSLTHIFSAMDTLSKH